jgi:hypothetical protein
MVLRRTPGCPALRPPGGPSLPSLDASRTPTYITFHIAEIRFRYTEELTAGRDGVRIWQS